MVGELPETRSCGGDGSDVDVEGAPVVPVLGEGDDGVQHHMTETLVQVASLIASWNDSGVRPKLVLSPASLGHGRIRRTAVAKNQSSIFEGE